MAEELEALLKRIQDEGVKEADAEKDKIIASAREEAEKIVSDAREEADKMRKEAKEEAELHHQKGQEALRQAARDVLLSLRVRLQEQMSDVVRIAAEESLNEDSAASLIQEVVKAYASKVGEVEQLDVLLPADRLEAVAAVFQSRLGDELRAKSEFKPVEDIQGGFQLVFNKQDVVYDFSDEALAETICRFLNPRLAEIVNGVLSDEQGPSAPGEEQKTEQTVKQ